VNAVFRTFKNLFMLFDLLAVTFVIFKYTCIKICSKAYQSRSEFKSLKVNKGIINLEWMKRFDHYIVCRTCRTRPLTLLLLLPKLCWCNRFYRKWNFTLTLWNARASEDVCFCDKVIRIIVVPSIQTYNSRVNSFATPVHQSATSWRLCLGLKLTSV